MAGEPVDSRSDAAKHRRHTQRRHGRKSEREILITENFNNRLLFRTELTRA